MTIGHSVRRWLFLSSVLLGAVLVLQPSGTAAQNRIAILGALAPATEGGLADQSAAALQAQGYAVTVLSGEQLADPAQLNAAYYQMLIVPHADVFPAAAQENLLTFLKAKGKMLCLGGPPFLRYAYSMNGQWQTTEANNNNRGIFSTPNTGNMPNGAPLPQLPVLDSLCPWYKLQNGQPTTWLPIERYLGTTAADPPGRLLHVDVGSQKASAWLYRPYVGPYKGAVWGAINAPGPDSILLARTVAAALRAVYVAHGGPTSVSYRAQTPIAFRARVVNDGDTPFPMRCAVRVMAATMAKATVSVVSRLSVAPGQAQNVTLRWPNSLVPGDYRYSLLFTDKTGGIVDSLTNRFTVLAVKPKLGPLVTIKNGDFQLDGKPWHPVGINFFPLWTSGESPDEEHKKDWRDWMAPSHYDPDSIERDLTLAQKLGMNAVSVRYMHTDEAPALNDFLVRCRAHGLHVNVAVHGGHPIYLELPLLASLITAARLPESDVVFAYDVAWEPFAGHQGDRRGLDPEWGKWLLDNYGSVENAEKDWSVAVPRENGKPTTPPDEAFTTDGPWRRMAAAYRRFLDDRVNWGYKQVQATVRALDPRHLIGARSGNNGNGSLGAEAVQAVDLRAGAKHLDFISPEGYSLSGNRQTFLGGGAFNVAYARWASGGKPVMWAEFGVSVYPYERQELFDAQTDFWDKMMQVVLTSGSSGAIGWIWQGGVRVDEVSDYGIIGPDGTPRPSARKLQQYAPQIKDRVLPLPGKRVEFVFDRDKDARGYNAVWTSGSPAVGAAVLAGDVPVLKTEGTGTSTATMPLVAVGNVSVTGSNPLKYADGELSVASVKSLGPGKIQIALTAGNTGEASWTVAGAGRVALRVSVDGKLIQTVPLPHAVARYEDVAFPALDVALPSGAELILRLAVLDRHPKPLAFGELVTLKEEDLHNKDSILGRL